MWCSQCQRSGECIDEGQTCHDTQLLFISPITCLSDMYESVRHPVGGMSFTQMCVKTQLQEVNVDDEPSTSPSIICSVFLTLLTGDTFTHWKEKNLSTAETEPNNSTDGQNFSGMHQIYIIKDANTAEVSCRRSKVCSIIGPLIHQEVLIRPPSLC